MSKELWKAGNMLYPVPVVMVCCGTMEESNIITVAWTGTIKYKPTYDLRFCQTGKTFLQYD